MCCKRARPHKGRPTSLIRDIRDRASGGNQTYEASHPSRARPSEPNSTPPTGPAGLLMQPETASAINTGGPLHEPWCVPSSQRLAKEATRCTPGRSSLGSGVAEPFDPAVALPAVGDDGAARLDVRGDERVQAGRRGIRDDAHPDPAVATGLVDLDCHCHKGFLALGPASAESRFLAADEGLVHLHPAGQAVASGAYQDRPQAVQHGPS